MGVELQLSTVLLLQPTPLLVGAWVFLHLRRQSTDHHGLGWLAIGFICIAMGAIVAGLTDEQPEHARLWPHLSLLCGTVGYTLVCSGFHRLAGSARWLRLQWLFLPSLVVTVVGVFTNFPVDNMARATAFHVFAIASMLVVAWDIQRQHRAEPLRTRPVLASVLLSCALLYALNLLNIWGADLRLLNLTDAFLLQILCNLAIALLTISLVNDRNHSRLDQLANTDPLTGVANRRRFVSSLPSQPEPGCAVMLMDLDHFKRINDQHGHAVGDAVLVACAQYVQSRMPAQALFARYGGEEFALFLPKVSATQAQDMANQLCEGVAKLRVPMGEAFVQVTISIGVRWLGMQAPSWQQALHMADEALYAAKSTGRNRVELRA